MELLPAPPVLRFAFEEEFCPLCGARLKALKSRRRRVATLHIGGFVADETIMFCERCPAHPRFRSRELAGLVSDGCNFGHDVMTHIGRSLFQQSRSVKDTMAGLAERNVRISASGVRLLGARFVAGLGAAHAETMPTIRQGLDASGGYVLHLDSTCRKGSSHLMTGLDEISGLVLLNFKMGGESTVEVEEFLREMGRRYGPPAAACCDMSSQILGALETVFRGTPVFICHFHFLRDLGKDLLEPLYAVVRARLRRHGVKTELARIQRDLAIRFGVTPEAVVELVERDGGAKPAKADGASRAVALSALVRSALEAGGESDGCGFPFDRPHLKFFQRTKDVLEAMKTLRVSEEVEPRMRRNQDSAIGKLGALHGDRKLSAAAKELELLSAVFDRLRTAMRIAEPDMGNGLNDNGDHDMASIEGRVGDFRVGLAKDKGMMAREAIQSMLDQMDKYWNMLFCDPITLQTTTGERTVQPHRTNNILEQFFRRLGHNHRKRTGSNPSPRSLDKMPVDLPLVANLDNQDYMRMLLGECESLEQRLAKVDRRVVNASMEMTRKATGWLPRKVCEALREKLAPSRIASYFIGKAD